MSSPVDMSVKGLGVPSRAAAPTGSGASISAGTPTAAGSRQEAAAPARSASIAHAPDIRPLIPISLPDRPAGALLAAGRG